MERWDDYVAVSFLPRDTVSHGQLPYEEIDERTYELRAAEVPDLTSLIERLEAVETTAMQSAVALEKPEVRSWGN